MRKKHIFENKKYKHIDAIPKLNYIIPKIKDKSFIESHGFYPFIGTTIAFKKYTKEINPLTKKHYRIKDREIKYASHIDSLIYQWYSHNLNKEYNKFAKDHGFNKSAVAYRTCFKGKSSIDFAYEVIEKIKELRECYIVISDFTKFFDNIDHRILKRNINRVMNFDVMPDDWYKVFKSMTKYCYIDKKSIENFLDNEEYQKYKNTSNASNGCYFENGSWNETKKYFSSEMKQNKNNSKECRGIPQGSPLSGIFSNVFMIDFDQKMFNYTKQLNGLYMRYCDDIAIVIPIEYVSGVSEIWNEMIKFGNDLNGLILNEEKTNCYIFKDKKIKLLSSDASESKKSSDFITFLGFSFDGKYTRIRDKTIIKYYYKIYRKIDKMKFHENERIRKGKIRKSKIDKHKILKELKTTGESRRFSDYLKRAKRIFKNENHIQDFDKKAKEKIFNRFNSKK